MTEFAFETDRLREQFAATRVGAAMHSAAGAVSRSWATSSARRTWQRAAGTVNRMTRAERVRAIGIWAVTAAITDAVLTPFDPRPATIGRWALWGGVLLLGAAAVVFAELVAAAWADWRARGSR